MKNKTGRLIILHIYGLSIILLSLLPDLYCFGGETKTFHITGRIIDFEARPVEGALVLCYGLESGLDQNNIWNRWKTKIYKPLFRTSTGPDGRFVFTVPMLEGFSPRLVAGKKGLALGWCHYTNNSELILTIRLGKPSLLKGTVVDEAEHPVPGAIVRICLKNKMMAEYMEIAPLDPENWFIARTDMNGQFVFDKIPKGSTADFEVMAPGRASIWTFFDCNPGLEIGEQFHAGQTEIRIKLPAEARLSGQVVNTSTGKALTGVGILARPYNRAGWHDHHCPDAVQTDADGRFELTGLAPAKYQLEAISDQARSACLTITLEAGQIKRNVKITLSRGIPFEAMVYDLERGNPVENADVTITQKPTEAQYDTFSQTATTDVNGLARFNVPPGDCEIKDHKFGYGAIFEPQHVQIDPGKVLQYEIFLPRTLRILSGEVLDEQGRTLAGASVMCTAFGPRTLTDAKGHFDTSHIGYHVTSSRFYPRERVLVRHVPSGLGAFGILEDPNKSGRLRGRITLEPAHTFIGRITDPDGKCIPAAYVKLLLSDKHRTLITEVLTDPNGTYCIPSVPRPGDNPRESYTIIACAENFGTAQIISIPWHDNTDEPIRLNPLILPPADKAISGYVLDANDQPVVGALVKVFGPRFSSNYGPPLRDRIVTDAQGRFRIVGLCEEPLEIHARSRSKKQQTGIVWAHGGNENIKIVLGQKLIFSEPLINNSLPDLKNLGINLSPANVNDQSILACFFDMNQRPSRNCLQQLNKKAQELKKKDIVVVAVQSSQIEENMFNKWVKDQNISFPVGIIGNNEEEVHFTWGVKSLPWLILTNQEHIVGAEGFALTELDEKLKANK